MKLILDQCEDFLKYVSMQLSLSLHIDLVIILPL